MLRSELKIYAKEVNENRLEYSMIYIEPAKILLANDCIRFYNRIDFLEKTENYQNKKINNRKDIKLEILKIQKVLQELSIDGWLFFDFHERDPIASKMLELKNKGLIFTRRWFYFIPAIGMPTKIVHAIEPYNLDHLQGNKLIYLAYTELYQALQTTLLGAYSVAMQYSPNCSIPYISIVDAGTMELVSSLGVKVVTSAELVSLFESHLSPEAEQEHRESAKIIDMIKNKAFSEIAERIKSGSNPTEYEIKDYMCRLLEEESMQWDMGPIVSVNEHNADAHFIPTESNSKAIKEGDLVLIDIWARRQRAGGVYADITWMAYVGETVPDRHQKMFDIVLKARDAGLNLIKKRFSAGEAIQGWEVDKVTRDVIEASGYGKYFTHRTGHNIGEEVHGPGVQMDNLETKDVRKIIAGSCFSIEPGIYIKDEGVGYRSEIDVLITNEGNVEIASEIQKEIVALL